jgi:PAS domain S-box-containing protein
MTQSNPNPNALALHGSEEPYPEQPPLGELLGTLYEHVLNCVSCSRIIFNGVEPVDRLYLYANQAFRSQAGLDDVVGRLASEIHAGPAADDNELLHRLARIARNGGSEVFEYLHSSTGQWYSMSVYSPVPGHVVKVCENITERKRMEEEREKYRLTLERRVEEQVQELRESEERYRGLFESLPVGIIVQAANGEITEVNQAACDMLRLDMDQFSGMIGIHASWQPVHEDGSPFPPEEHPSVQTLKTGQPQQGVIMGLGDGSDRTWISINSHPLFRKGSPLPYAVLCSFIDITSHVHNEEVVRVLNRGYQDLLSSSTELAIIASDLNGVITLFNSGAERMLGYTSEEVVGRMTPMQFHPRGQLDALAKELGHEPETSLDGLHAVLSTVRKEGRFHRELTYLRKDGSSLLVSIWLTPVRTANEELSGHLAVVQDISNQEHPYGY